MSSSEQQQQDATSKKQKRQKWFPLESNPSLMNNYVKKLGFDTTVYEFVDVFSTEDWALDIIPQPVEGVLFLYPLTEKLERKDDAVPFQTLPDIWFIKQRIGNACGTIGLLHTLSNTSADVQSCSIQASSWLQSFLNDCPAPLDAISKAERLEGDSKIAAFHEEATSSEQNQTSRPNMDDDIETHFIAFIHHDSKLFELDGRKQGPVPHGDTSPATLLKDACTVIKKKFMNRDPTEMRFTIIALARKQED